MLFRTEQESEPVVIRRIVMPFPMHRFGPQQMGPQMGPQFQQQQQPQFAQFVPENQVNMRSHMNYQGPPPMNFQGPPMNLQGPPQMNFQGPPPHMNFQGPPPPQQMNFQGPPRMPFPQQNMQFPQQQFPPVPAQQMSPPRPEVPQFRLINPAPQQQQLPNFERPQSQEIEQPNPQPEFRIQLRRIQFPGPMGPIGDILPFLNNIQNNIQNDMQKEAEAPRQNVQLEQMPLAVALSKVGITPDDLRNIQRMAEEKFHEHIRELVAEEDGDSDSDSTQSGEESDSGIQTTMSGQDSSEESQKNQELHEASSQQQSDDKGPQILALGRSNFGRSLNPVQLPGRMSDNAEIQEAERADCEFINCF